MIPIQGEVCPRCGTSMVYFAAGRAWLCECGEIAGDSLRDVDGVLHLTPEPTYNPDGPTATLEQWKREVKRRRAIGGCGRSDDSMIFWPSFSGFFQFLKRLFYGRPKDASSKGNAETGRRETNDQGQDAAQGVDKDDGRPVRHMSNQAEP